MEEKIQKQSYENSNIKEKEGYLDRLFKEDDKNNWFIKLIFIFSTINFLLIFNFIFNLKKMLKFMLNNETEKSIMLAMRYFSKISISINVFKISIFGLIAILILTFIKLNKNEKYKFYKMNYIYTILMIFCGIIIIYYISDVINFIKSSEIEMRELNFYEIENILENFSSEKNIILISLIGVIIFSFSSIIFNGI